MRSPNGYLANCIAILNIKVDLFKINQRSNALNNLAKYVMLSISFNDVVASVQDKNRTSY